MTQWSPLMDDGWVAYPQTVQGPMQRRRRPGAVLALVVVAGAVFVAAGVAIFGFLGAGILSCDREFRTLSKALPDDPGVSALQSRFPTHGDADTGCDEDDNTASADVEFQTGLDRPKAVEVGGGILTSNGWDEGGDPDSRCYTKQIRGFEVFAQFPPPDGYEEPGTDLVISLQTDQCWTEW